MHALKAVALFGLKRREESIREFRIAIAKNPKDIQAHNNLAEVLRTSGSYDDALAECRAAMEINPETPEGHRIMANILLAKTIWRGDGALQAALKLRPDDPLVHEGLANLLWRQGKFQEAVEHRKQQMALQPQNLAMAVKVATQLISDPRPEARFGAEAVEIARRLCEATDYQDIIALDVLAAAYAETGDFDQAEATVRKAMETPLGQTPANAVQLQKRLMCYHAHQKPPIPPPLP